jgi:hypothetical protein
MFLHQKENIININNQVRLTVDQFRALEPSYPSLPSGYVERYYETGKRHDISCPGKPLIRESKQWADGDRFFRRINDFLRLQQIIQLEEATVNNAVEAELNKRKTYEELRKTEYPKIEDLVIAMWQNLIEKQSKEDSGVKDLQKIRKEIKEKYPKPEE